jgi:hypothetical protein
MVKDVGTNVAGLADAVMELLGRRAGTHGD